MTLQPSSIIANFAVAPQILSHTAVTSYSPSKNAFPLKFDFGESSIPSEWKTRVTEKLTKMPEVFAISDMDFGRTDKVKHHINLQGETLFKHRARPIHSLDIEAVRQHLRDLLDTGVIRKSESSFSSPIT